MPFYVTDNSLVTDATGWTPRRRLDAILDDVFAWLRENQRDLEPILGVAFRPPPARWPRIADVGHPHLRCSGTRWLRVRIFFAEKGFDVVGVDNDMRRYFSAKTAARGGVVPGWSATCHDTGTSMPTSAMRGDRPHVRGIRRDRGCDPRPPSHRMTGPCANQKRILRSTPTAR